MHFLVPYTNNLFEYKRFDLNSILSRRLPENYNVRIKESTFDLPKFKSGKY